MPNYLESYLICWKVCDLYTWYSTSALIGVSYQRFKSRSLLVAMRVQLFTNHRYPLYISNYPQPIFSISPLVPVCLQSSHRWHFLFHNILTQFPTDPVTNRHVRNHWVYTTCGGKHRSI